MIPPCAARLRAAVDARSYHARSGGNNGIVCTENYEYLWGGRRSHDVEEQRDAVVLARHDAGVLACRAVRSAPLLCALTCAALLAGSSVARAADSGEVERLIRQGVELRMKHDDQQALPLFQKAYGMAATPRTAAQLGLVELSLGYLLESERHLTESLAATHDVWVKRNRPALERSLAKVKARIGELQIKGSPTGADVKLNGTVVGKLPLEAPLRIGEGPANVEVTAPGFKTASHSLAVTGGKRSAWAVELEPERPAVVAAAPALQPPPETATATTLPLQGGPLQATPTLVPTAPREEPSADEPPPS